MKKCNLNCEKIENSIFGTKFGYFGVPWGSKKANFTKSFCLPLHPPHNNLQTNKFKSGALEVSGGGLHGVVVCMGWWFA